MQRAGLFRKEDLKAFRFAKFRFPAVPISTPVAIAAILKTRRIIDICGGRACLPDLTQPQPKETCDDECIFQSLPGLLW